MMNRTALASKAQALLNASQGLGGGLSEEVQDACRTYAQRRARMVTELRAAQGPFTGTASVQAQGSLECMEEGRVGVLVFCSATRPGGGWLTGATAQEESISRASTWALSCAHPEFHAEPSTTNYFYKDAILAVDGMVFERNNTPLAKPAPVHFVGMCAPNARAMQEHGMQPQATSMRARIVEALVLRMRLALQAFGDAGCTTAVLGAVGCGVFQIQPGDCVRAWQRAIALDGAPFERIVFALGPTPSAEMQQAFSGLEKACGFGLGPPGPGMA